MAEPENSRAAGLIAFQYPSFVFFQTARFFIVLATEMQSVAVGWQVYEITKRPLDLGFVGLAQFLPGILLFLVSGHVADRHDRRKLIVVCYIGFALCCGLLLLTSVRGVRSVYYIFGVLVLLGVVRSFTGPVSRALVPQLLPEEHFTNAVAWASTIFQGAAILGPALGGLIYAFFRGPSAVYVLAVLMAIAAVICTLKVKTQSKPRSREPINLATVSAGTSLHLARKSGTRFHLAGFVRGLSRRGRRAPARLCPRNSADRPLGPRPASRRPRSGSRRDGYFPCASAHSGAKSA